MTRRLLVRHAHAGARGSWAGDDLARPLSRTGRAQAATLVELLQRLRGDLTTVASSRAVRCVATVEPLADALGATVTATPVLLEGADPAAALRWLEGPDGADVACSHGDVIGGIVERLVRRGVVDSPARWPKASTWVLDVEDGEVTRAWCEPLPTED